MSVKTWKTIISCVGIFLFIGDFAQAVPITIKITGIVTEITGMEPYPYNETIYTGATFTGSYTYNSSTIGEYQQPGRGRYAHSSPYGFDVSLGGFDFQTVGNHDYQFTVWLYNNYSQSLYDGYSVVSNKNAPLYTGLSVHRIAWDLRDNTHAALSSIALPLDAPDINAWSYNFFSIDCGGLGSDNPLFSVWGTVTDAVLVPEPTTLFMLGLGGLLIRRK